MTTPGLSPYKNLPFRLEIRGRELAGFSRVDGLFRDDGRFREGAPDARRPPPPAVNLLTLHRGLAAVEVAAWCRSPSPDPRDFSLRLVDDAGAETARWDLLGARPGPYRATSGDGEGDAVDTLGLVFDSMRRSG